MLHQPHQRHQLTVLPQHQSHQLTALQLRPPTALRLRPVTVLQLHHRATAHRPPTAHRQHQLSAMRQNPSPVPVMPQHPTPNRPHRTEHPVDLTEHPVDLTHTNQLANHTASNRLEIIQATTTNKSHLISPNADLVRLDSNCFDSTKSIFLFSTDVESMHSLRTTILSIARKPVLLHPMCIRTFICQTMPS